MTVDELLEAIRAARSTDDGEGITISEMARSAKKSEPTIRRMVRPLIEEGQLRPTKKRIKSIGGTMVWVTSYAMVEAPKGKRGRA